MLERMWIYVLTMSKHNQHNSNAAQPEEELVQKILFWQKPKPEGDVIDPVKEKAKLIQQETEAVPLAP